jgi:hypothetical protein
MSRFRRFLSVGLAGVFVFAVGAGQASAKGASKKKKAVATQKKGVTQADVQVAPPNAEQKKALAELKGVFNFGMTKDEVIATLSKQIEQRYTEQIRATSDVYAQDQFRKEKSKEIALITSSYTEFKGVKTGWDVSLIDQEFAHNTDESMLVVWENSGDKDQRRFFFFFEGKLWKMFVAIGTKALPEERRSFDAFRTVLEARYGLGKVESGRETWKTPDFEVQAVDRLGFYGVFGLLIQKPSVLKALTEVRVANAPAAKGKDPLMEVIKDKGGAGPGLDDNKDATDAIISGARKQPSTP